MNITLKELQEKIHGNAVNKGFWDKEKNFAEELMLVVTELSESVEAHRNDKKAKVGKHKMQLSMNSEKFTESFEKNIKDSVEDELADSIIRVIDLCAGLNIDIEYFIKEKMKYNETREYLHGKKY